MLLHVLLLFGRKAIEFLWSFSFVFCRFLKLTFRRESPISTGRSDRLKLGKLTNVIGHIGSETIQFSLSLLSGAALVQVKLISYKNFKSVLLG